MDRELPISRERMEKPKSLLLPNEVLPIRKRRAKASFVSRCAVLIVERSVEGTRSRQSFLPGSESDFSVRRSMIFVYSKVVSTFVFMWGSLILKFAIRTIVLLAHAVQARKCYAFPRCRAFALSKSDLSITPASSRIDISRFWYCSMLVYIITRFLRAAHSRNRYIHSQSGLSSFLLMSVCSPHRNPALPASSHAGFYG